MIVTVFLANIHEVETNTSEWFYSFSMQSNEIGLETRLFFVTFELVYSKLVSCCC